MYSGRKLTWLWNLSRNELRTTYTGQKYTFQVSSHQSAILLQFNHLGDSVSFEDLKAATKMDDNTLKGNLSLMCKQKVIEEKDSNYELNLKFRSKKVSGLGCFDWASVQSLKRVSRSEST